MTPFLEFIIEHQAVLMMLIGVIWLVSLVIVCRYIFSYESYRSDAGDWVTDIRQGRPYDNMSRRRLWMVIVLAPIFAVVFILGSVMDY
jgi:hypothetical protein